MHRLSGLLLVIALLLGQMALLEHEYDFSAHKPGDTCVTCLHATPVGHAVAGSMGWALPFLPADVEFSQPDLHFSTIVHCGYRARAPPSLPTLS